MKAIRLLILASTLMAVLLLGSCDPTGGTLDNGVTADIAGTVSWATGSTYHITSNISVTGALTIQPGVTVNLDAGCSITVAAGASLTASGTQAQPIVFQATVSTAKWGQIFFAQNAIANTLKYCTIQDAGLGNLYAVAFSSFGGAKADIQSCTLKDNAYGGIDASFAAATTTIKGNTFYGNTEIPLIVNDSVDFDATNKFAATGTAVDLTNVKNCVYFVGDIATTRTFDITEVPYYFYGNVGVVNGGNLTINPGVTLLFDTGVSLSVEAGGTLNATGTGTAASTGILFKSKGTAVQWGQIFFAQNAIANTLKYCTIQNAGTGSLYAVAFSSFGGARADIQSCTFHDNAYGGIDAYYAAATTTIKGNTFHANTEIPLIVNDNVSLDATNKFAATGTVADLTNAKNCVYFVGDIATVRTFDITEVPYYFYGNVGVISGGNLKINPGVTLMFDTGVSFSVDAGGTLNATGTGTAASTGILFKSKGTAVRWGQIFFGQDATANTLKYCTMQNAGSGGEYAIAFSSFGGAKADIQDCAIKSNLAGGISAIYATAVTTVSNNTFENNNANGSTIFDLDINGAPIVQSGNTSPTTIYINP